MTYRVLLTMQTYLGGGRVAKADVDIMPLIAPLVRLHLESESDGIRFVGGSPVKAEPTDEDVVALIRRLYPKAKIERTS